MHGNVEVCCVASDKALVLLLTGTAAYLPDLSAADHLITPCWLGMVQMVSAVVEAGDVSQLRLIQRPHDVRVPTVGAPTAWVRHTLLLGAPARQ